MHDRSMRAYIISFISCKSIVRDLFIIIYMHSFILYSISENNKYIASIASHRSPCMILFTTGPLI